MGARASAAILTFARCASEVIGSPRFSKALPPRATTIRMASFSQGRHEQGLDGVHAVLGLLEGDVRLGLEHVVGDFDTVGQTIGLGDLLAERSLRIVEG